MKVPFIDLSPQHKPLAAQFKKAIGDVLDSQHFILSGNGLDLEGRVSKLTGAKHAIAVASGSDALYLALKALDVGPGDEVITTPFTFFATAGAVTRTGAVPVFADIDSRTFNLDPASVRSKISAKTKVVLPVHLYGLPCAMDALLETARERLLKVVEDVAQAFGAEYKGRMAGAIGDAGCFSFYPTKNLGGAGDGGCVVSSNRKTAEKIRLLRHHGETRKYYHEFVGTNSRLDEIQAAFLLIKLKHVERWNEERISIAARYDESFKGLPLRTPFVPPDAKHVYHLYTVLSKERDALKEFLGKKGIGTGIYYPLPLHLQPCFKDLGYRRGDLPNSERAAGQILSLPMYPGLGGRELAFVIGAVREYFGHKP